MKREFFRIAYKYIVLFLVAAVLCVGSVYARYGTGSSGTVNTEIAAMGCSFTIDNVSATTFTNAYWLYETNAGEGIYNYNSMQSVQYTIYNYEDHTVADPETSSVDVQSVYRMTIPYLYMRDIAVQMVSLNGTTETAVTTQYDLHDILSEISTRITNSPGSTSLDGNYDTSSAEYNDITYSGVTGVTVSWQYDGNGTTFDNISKITMATSDNVIVTLRKTSSLSSLQLAYTRSRTIGAESSTHPYYASELLVEYAADSNDSTATTLLTDWTIDVSVGEMFLAQSANTEQKSFKFYLIPVASQTFAASYDYDSNSVSYASQGTTYNNRVSLSVSISSGGGNGNTASTTVTSFGVSVDAINYNITDVSLYSDSACTSTYWAGTGTVRVRRTGAGTAGDPYAYTYYYYDSASGEYLDLTETANGSGIYTVTDSENDTYYINSAEQVGEYTVDLYTTNTSGTLSDSAGTGLLRVIRTGDGTGTNPYAYTYYYYDTTNSTYILCSATSDSGVYSVTVSTTSGNVTSYTTYYFKPADYTIAVETTVYSDASCSAEAGTGLIQIAYSSSTSTYTYSYYYSGYQTMTQYQSGDVYYYTVSGTSYYIDTSTLNKTGIETCNIKEADALYSYDKVCSYLVGGVATGASVHTIYYTTKSQVLFYQASTVTENG